MAVKLISKTAQIFAKLEAEGKVITLNRPEDLEARRKMMLFREELHRGYTNKSIRDNIIVDNIWLD